MIKKRNSVKFLLLITALLPFFLVAALLVPDVQKHLVKTHLTPWISNANVEYIQITPFSFKIRNLTFKYDAIDIHIGHLDSQFSPFELLNQRIKINNFILKNVQIDDLSIPDEEKQSSTLLFPGLFPYLDSGYIYDIAHLDAQADYNSSTTGPVQLILSAQSVHEESSNPLKLQIIAKQLPDIIPDIKELILNSNIFLNQHSNRAVNAQHSNFDFTLVNHEGISQFLKLQLKMNQLPLPERWESFPLDKHRKHYLEKILHPEKIELQISHTNQNNKTLSSLKLNGQYDGNEGIISGAISLQSDKDFLKLFKTLQLPKIESDLSATFQYNTHFLQGDINLTDEFEITDLSNEINSSLPEQIDVSNHLIAHIDKQKILIDSFLLNILNIDQQYIKIFTHKPISVDLDNLPAFLSQKASDLISINIQDLPLNWFNEFIADYHIEDGILDTDINLSIDNKTLTLKSNRPLRLSNLSLSNDAEETNNKQPLLIKQNLDTEFTIKINEAVLNADITKLDLYKLNKTKEEKDNILHEAATTISLNLKKPFEKDALTNPLTVQSKGNFNLNAVIKIPLFEQLLKESFSESFEKTLPKQFSLQYDISLQGDSEQWDLNKSIITFAAEKNKNIINLQNKQNIQFKLGDQFVLLTQGDIVSAQIRQFNLDWLAPVINQYATPYSLSGWIGNIDLLLSANENNNYLLNINKFKLNKLKAYENKDLLFDNVSLDSKIQSSYTAEKLSINYPHFTIKQNNSVLLKNNGSITINQPGGIEKQQIDINGKLNSYIHRVMNLNLVKQHTKNNIAYPSVLNADYKINVQNDTLTINQSDLLITHPKSKGQIKVKTHKPISFFLQNKELDKQLNFLQDGHLSFNFNNFDLKPYEAFLSEIPVTFNHATGSIDLYQNKKKQSIIFKQPLKIVNVNFKDRKNALLNPFDFNLDFEANQYKKITYGKIKDLSILFADKKEKALTLKAKFKLNQGNKIIVSELDSDLKLLLTQWLNQPAVMPDNTLTQGTLNAKFTLDKQKNIKHIWSIDNLKDKQGEQIVESIAINGIGQLESLSSYHFDFPVVMKSLSGITHLNLKTHTQLLKKNKKLSVEVDGKEVFLNDLLKLLDTINPQSEISELEPSEDAKPEETEASMNLKADTIPFWHTGIDISAQLDIEKLYYTDYMSYHDISGDIEISDTQFYAKSFAMNFHESPMLLNTHLQFDKSQKKPYNINLTTSLSEFAVGSFLRELNENHIPRADGVFDVNINIYGGMTNLSQFRNELLFDIKMDGKDGVYHLIPANDVLTRSGGAAIAVIGEVVSVLPTSGFGLGIVSRVVRFAKDIDYDHIRVHMVRQSDLNTKIEEFRILSPELHLLATGGITYKKDTRLFDQPLAMDAHVNLAGEGAAIFYGLGLLNKEQDEYGFWKGPVINFTGSINYQEDNLDEIISKAKEGTVIGGITNPFSGLVGDFKYRWFGKNPDYSKFKQAHSKEKADLKAPVK